MLVDDDRLMRLAEAVVDGMPVDWAKELSSTPDLEMRQLVEKCGCLRPWPPFTVRRMTAPAIPSSRARDGSTSWGRWSCVARSVRKLWNGAPGVGSAARARGRAEDSPPVSAIRQRHPGRSPAREHPASERRECLRGVDEFDDAVGLRMELVDGLTLKQTLQQRGVFGACETALIGTDLCRAVAV